MYCAIRSLPTPLSPERKTFASPAATRAAVAHSPRIAGLAQTMTGSRLREPTLKTADDTVLLQLTVSLRPDARGFAGLHACEAGWRSKTAANGFLRLIS